VSFLHRVALVSTNDAPRRERDWVLAEFKAGHSPILIATDVASRGLGMCFLTVASASTLRRDTTGNKQIGKVVQRGYCATLLYLFPGMMTGTADTARYTCGATGLPCVLLTPFIYQVPGCISNT
jgi:hypothetical protein